MEAAEAKRMTQEVLDKDYLKYPKYFQKAVSKIEKEIKEKIKFGLSDLFISELIICNHIKLPKTANSVLLGVMAELINRGFRVTLEQHGINRFLKISWI